MYLSDRSTDEAPQQAAPAVEEQTDSVPSTGPKEIKEQSDKLVAEGKKAIALKQWEEGVNKYGEALDLMRQLVGEFDPAMAPLLLSYGKALYELAFSQQGVMGKEEGSKEADEAVRDGALEEAPSKNGNFVFSADPQSDDEEAEAEAGPSTASGPSVENQGENGQEEGEPEDEPEDDYNAAWEVLDVARTIYQKIISEKETDNDDDKVKEDKLNLADCYLALGDVSCETENFPQAVQDYTSALEIQNKLLPLSSRILASTHYQLATVLEFTPNKKKEALDNVEKSLNSFTQRLQQLENKDVNVNDLNDLNNEEIKKLNEKEKEKEINDVRNLIEDLKVKIEELKSNSSGNQEENDLISKSINHLLGNDQNLNEFGSASSSITTDVNAVVNDLTSMVKKKKPKVVPSNTQEVKKVVNELIENVQDQSKPIIEQTEQIAESAQQKLGEIAVTVGESLQSTGEALKRESDDNDKEKEEGEERKSKKAKIE
ncbi:uncharacterized protein L201_004650 [Kwoniella dendrophila CBS 6074]|uniref:Tetratricopeptide SHNi-TPR domain-containing protein n=1 Tax=Kwoniella dendrophila CBS 6074 TaxID=1295534 RepID=A0AAX4JWA2_9TREE